MNNECPLCPTCINNDEWELDLCDCKEDRKQSLICVCGLCGCGSPEVAELLYEVLSWCAIDHKDDGRNIPPFNKNGCYCSVGHELAAKVLDKARLIDHGSGIGWPWVTDKGRQLLAWIDKEAK